MRAVYNVCAAYAVGRWRRVCGACHVSRECVCVRCVARVLYVMCDVGVLCDVPLHTSRARVRNNEYV